MIQDANAIFSGSISAAGVVSGQTVTGTDTTVLSTNTYDLGVARDVGKGESLNIAIEVITAASGGTSVQFQLIEADDAALTSNVKIINETGAIPVASLTINKQFNMPVGRVDPNAAKRYLGIRYALVGAVAAGAYFAALTKDAQDPGTYYASGFSVL